MADRHFDRLARQVVITLTQPDTHEVVLQIPPEKILKLAAHLKEVVARMIDERA